MKQTHFKEIYLIRYDKDGYYYVPLKGFLFFSSLYFFHDILGKMQVMCNEMEFHNFFGETLQILGFDQVRLLTTVETVDVVYGNYGIGVRDLKHIHIKDLSEASNLSTKLASIEKTDFLSEATISCIRESEKTFYIEGEFHFKLEDINSTPKL